MEKLFKSVESALRANSVAIVGASEQNSWAKAIYGNLIKVGYPGEVKLVNPRHEKLWDQRCFPSLSAIGGAVEHAAVLVGPDNVHDVLADGVTAGLKSAVVFAANLGEGKARSKGAILARLCDRTGLVICGPNCLGTLSVRERLLLFPSPQLVDVQPGHVGMVSQSGGTVQAYVKAAADRGVGFSYCISSGNELNLDLADFVDFLVDDPQTQVIVLFLEAIRRPQAFMRAAEQALQKAKPIIAFKVGRSETGRRAALSHTGAVAGDYAAFEAVCDRYGIINCRSLESVLETTIAFQAGRLPRGRRIAFVTTSGAMVDMLHDSIEDQDATLARLLPQTLRKLKPLVQKGIHPSNPLDAGSPKGLASAADLCRIMLDDSNVDMLAWAVWLGRSAGFGDLEPMRRVVEATGKPFLGFGRMHAQMNHDAIAVQAAMGLPFLQGIGDTIDAMKALAFYAERRGRILPKMSKPSGSAAGLDTKVIAKELDRYGLQAPRQAVATSLREAMKAANAIGFPVALKLAGDSLHKTEVGGVRLDLRNPAEVERAWRELQGLRGFNAALVQEMVQGVEVVIGAREDDLYGPLIVVGSGGVFVELLGDATTRLLPVDRTEVREMIAGLKLAALLKGFRGGPVADVEALTTAVVGLGRFFAVHRNDLADIEVNPLIVRAKGAGVAAVDIRVLRKA